MERRRSKKCSWNQNTRSKDKCPEKEEQEEKEQLFTDHHYAIIAKKIEQVQDSAELYVNISDDEVLTMRKETETDLDSNSNSKNYSRRASNKENMKKVSRIWESEQIIGEIKTILEENAFQESEDFEKITEKLAHKAAAVNCGAKTDQILTISNILQEYINRGITAVYTPETNTNDIIKIKIAANSCLTMLHLLNIFKIDEIEIVLQKVVDFTKNQIRTSLIPEYQNCSYKVTEKQHENIKLHLNSVTFTIYQKICEIIALLTKTIQGRTILDDYYYTTSLLYTAFGVFQTKHMIELQTVCLQMVAKIFSNKSEDPEISQLIMRELLSSKAPQIEDDYHILNQYKARFYTVLVLQIIQSKCYVSARKKVDDILKNAIGKQLSTAKFCSEFIKQLLAKSTAKDEGFKTVIKTFIGDLIALVEKPEWPAAVHLIQELSNVLSDENTEDEIRNVCIDFVPQIVVKLKSILTKLLNKEHFQRIVENNEDESVFCLQQQILNFLEYDSDCDDVYHYAFFFNMTLWLKNNFQQCIRDSKTSKFNKKSISPIPLIRMKKILNRLTDFNARKNKPNETQVTEYQKTCFMSQCVYFGSDLLNCCERYISVLRKVIVDGNSPREISKSLKGAMFVEEQFPNTFSPLEISDYVNRYAFDKSATVKESVINLLGKYLVGNPQLSGDHYRKLLCEKLRSEDVNVRKRSVEILRKIHGNISNENNLYLILAKFHQDAKISKAILDIFEEKWFTLSEDSLESVVTVVKQANDIQLKQLTSIFVQLYNRKQNANIETKKVKMITNAIELVLQSSPSDQTLVPYLVVIHMITKANCNLTAKYAEELHNMVDFNPTAVHLVQKYVIKIIKLIIPVINDRKELINQVERKLLRALGFLESSLMKCCVVCLEKLVHYTKNYSFIDKVVCINYNLIRNIDKSIIKNEEEWKIKRSLLLVGLLIHVFNFEDSAVVDPEIVENVFQLLTRTLTINNNDSIKSNILECLGLICVKYDHFFLNADFQNVCFEILKNEDGLPKLEILKMFKCYLHRQLEMEAHSLEEKKKLHNIKEMVDDTLGKPSTIIKTFIKHLLRCVISRDSSIRQVTMEIIQQVHRLGYVNPVEIIPFLICMTFDSDETMSETAQSHLSELQLKYPDFINSESLSGITLSYELHNKIGDVSSLTRGLLLFENGPPVKAVNDFLYKLLQQCKRHWRGLIFRVLKQFEEKEKHDLEYLIFLADNVSAFPYKTLDEVYFAIYYINELSIHYGANTLRTLKQEKKVHSNYATADLKNYIYNFRVHSLLYQLKYYLMKKYGLKDADMREYSPSITLKTNGNVACCINYEPFEPKDVVNACLEEKNKNGNKKKHEQKLKETFLKEFRIFQNRVRTDEGDEDYD